MNLVMMAVLSARYSHNKNDYDDDDDNYHDKNDDDDDKIDDDDDYNCDDKTGNFTEGVR